MHGHGIKSTFCGQLTHTDTWGPFASALYFTGCRYIIVFCDDFSRIRFAVFAKDRVTATLIDAYKLYAAFMRKLGVEILAEWASDGGAEYVSHEAFDFCDEHGIQRLLSVRYVPQSNGVAESVFRVYIPRTRAALDHGALPKRAYALGFQYCLWLSNRTWAKQLGCRPFDKLPNPPECDIAHAHSLGCA